MLRGPTSRAGLPGQWDRQLPWSPSWVWPCFPSLTIHDLAWLALGRPCQTGRQHWSPGHSFSSWEPSPGHPVRWPADGRGTCLALVSRVEPWASGRHPAMNSSRRGIPQYAMNILFFTCLLPCFTYKAKLTKTCGTH